MSYHFYTLPTGTSDYIRYDHTHCRGPGWVDDGPERHEFTWPHGWHGCQQACTEDPLCTAYDLNTDHPCRLHYCGEGSWCAPDDKEQHGVEWPEGVGEGTTAACWVKKRHGVEFYHVNSQAGNQCEKGSSHPIATEDECRKAAKILDPDQDFRGSHPLDYAPTGCLFYKGPETAYRGVYYNTHPTGGSEDDYYKVCRIGGGEPASAKYFVGHDRMKHAQAKAFCESKGSKLASIHSREQESAIRQVIVDEGVEEAWIGAEPTGKEGLGQAWKWVDHSPWDFNSDLFKDGGGGADSISDHGITLRKAGSDDNVWNIGTYDEEFPAVCQILGMQK